MPKVDLILDGDSRIIASVPCIGCDYNLRGLRPDGDCPECGTPIARTFRGDLIRFASANWANGVSAGIKLWIIGIVVGLITFSCGNPDWLGEFIMQFIGGTLVIVGAWRATRRDPERLEEPESLNARYLVRVVIPVCILWQSIDLILLDNSANAPASTWWMILIDTMFTLVQIVAIGLFGWRLAKRLGTRNIAQHIRIVAIGLVTVTIAQLLLLMLHGWLASPVVPVPARLYAGIGDVVFEGLWLIPVIPVSVATLVFAIWSFVLFFRVRNGIKREIEIGRQIKWSES